MNYDFYESPYRPEETRRNEEPIPTTDFKVEDLGPSPDGPKKKKRVWPKVVALCLVCAILGTAGGAAVATALVTRNSQIENMTTIYESNRVPTVVGVTHTNTGKQLTLEEVYASWVNSTVGISTEIVTTNWFGQQVSGGAAAGSGFVISSDGYIVTNYHVIEGASTIKVTFYDGTEYDATLVGGEANNDVAVLKIDAKDLTPVIIGNSDGLHVGQTVTAIGNPLGELTFSQSAGIISAKDRTVTLDGGIKINMIQTDCTINAGNSGGPLFNLYGEVIGITSAKYSNNGSYSEATIEGIGFAIPMNDVSGIIKDLIEHGYVTGKPNVGVLLDDVDSNALRYGIPDGAEIMAVLEGSCAEKSGLQVGDIVTKVNDTEITSVAGLQEAVKTYRAGDTVTFTVYRDGDTSQITMTLDESNQARAEAMDALSEEYEKSQQQNQQQPNGYYPGYGYGFGWPFGW